MKDLSRLFLEYARLDRRRTREGLSVRQLQRWRSLKRALEGHFSGGREEPDRRESIRVDTRLHCSFASVDAFEKAPITSLSRGGVFIHTQTPLPIGSRLNLCISIGRMGANIEVPGVVVSNSVRDGSDAGRIGMGVRFSTSVPEIIDQIDDLYEREIERSCAGGDAKKPPLGLRRLRP